MLLRKKDDALYLIRGFFEATDKASSILFLLPDPKELNIFDFSIFFGESKSGRASVSGVQVP